jgi:hypothetical protein
VIDDIDGITLDPPHPGETCGLCERRMPHPKKETSPTTKTRSYRVPLDEAEAHEDVLTQAAKFLGCYERPHWQYQTYTLGLAAILQDEGLRGFAQRAPDHLPIGTETGEVFNSDKAMREILRDDDPVHSDGGAYELNDPKHPTFHERYADSYDNRDKFA